MDTSENQFQFKGATDFLEYHRYYLRNLNFDIERLGFQTINLDKLKAFQSAPPLAKTILLRKVIKINSSAKTSSKICFRDWFQDGNKNKTTKVEILML